jgi:CheY-like chemotaxis protein
MSHKPIIVVDDNPVNLKLARVVLTNGGFPVYIATNAAETLTILDTIYPGLILMDIQLPDVDGLTLTRQLKADPRTQHIPIIALTAFAMKGDEHKAREAGCDGYISKPIDVDAFIEIVTRVLAGQEIW